MVLYLSPRPYLDLDESLGCGRRWYYRVSRPVERGPDDERMMMMLEWTGAATYDSVTRSKDTNAEAV